MSATWIWKAIAMRLARMTQPLRKATQADTAVVLDGLESRWSMNALDIQQRLSQAIDEGDAANAQRWAVAGGISTEKVLLLKGRPTEIVASLHAHRHEIGPLFDRLAQMARGQSAGVPVVHSHLVGPKGLDAGSTHVECKDGFS